MQRRALDVMDKHSNSEALRFDMMMQPGDIQYVNNFVVLARYHYYDGSAVFRADRSIEILQGGAPTTNTASDPGPGYTIADECGPFTYVAGQLVMARTAQPDSAGAQFFFTAGGRPFCLHAVLGSHSRRAPGSTKVAALLSRTTVRSVA